MSKTKYYFDSDNLDAGDYNTDLVINNNDQDKFERVNINFDYRPNFDFLKPSLL